MKNMEEATARLRAELDQWFKKQIKNEYGDYYLYYLPTTPEHAGGFLILEDPPANPEFKLAAKVRKDLTVEQNLRALTQVMRRLPILEY